MSTASPQPLPSFEFTRNKKFLAGSSAIGIDIEGAGNAELAQALMTDQPFPPGDFEPGIVSLEASSGKDIQFESPGRGSVSFSASAGTSKALGIYSDAQALLRQLAPARNPAPEIELPAADSSRYVMLKWSYDVKAAAKGSLALAGGAGSLRFGVDAGREALYAVVRNVPGDTGARTALADTVESWILPRHVATVEDLKPGTWIVSEVDGTVAAELGVQFGYDYNWIREAKLGGLSGDVGLRIELAVGARLGITASGHYALVLSRASRDPNEKVLRLQIFRLSKKGWSFAFDAGAGIQGDFGDLLPEKADDFVAAVFGVHGAQIVKDLESVAEWTDPSRPLPEALSDLTATYVKEILQETTGIDPEREFEKARSIFLDAFDRWDDLGHSVSSQLWSLLRDSDEKKIRELAELAKTLSEAEEESVRKLIKEQLEEVDFFKSPVGKWLESVSSKGLVTLLNNRQELEALRQAAALTASVLDGGVVEKVIRGLQSVVERRLNLDEVRRIANETDFEKMDLWLRKKLSEFLGSKLDFDRLEEIRQTIHLLLDKREEFYGKALQALTRRYNFQLAAAYQASSSRTALLDVSFDFSVDAGAAEDALSKAIDGRFDTLLTTPLPGVRLNLATLTHELERQSHVELTMPYFEFKTRSISRSLAKVSATDDDGRILLYELDARDVVSSVTRGKSARDSCLAISACLPVAANRTRIHSTRSLTYSYSLRQFKRAARTADLQYQLKPYVRLYLPDSFGGAADKDSFDTWVGDLDKATDELRDNGTGNLGDILLTLELSLPPEGIAAWTRSPAKDAPDFPIYLSMSRHLQRKLKELIPFYYFQDPEKYDDLDAAAPLLVYSAIEPANEMKLKGGRAEPKPGRGIYWNWPDSALRRAMICSASTTANLATTVERVHNLLESVGLGKIARFYEPNAATLHRLISTTMEETGERLLQSLLFVEAQVVKSAMQAGLDFAAYLAKSDSKPSGAVEALAKFGRDVTTAFHKNIAGVYCGGEFRPFGTLVFAEAARALDPSPAALRPAAMLTVSVLKENTGLTADTVLGREPGPEDLLLQGRIVSVQG